jgi:UPF0271 protein
MQLLGQDCRVATRLTIDLNADLGETEGDLALLSVVTSANVACGGHAGDVTSMRQAVSTARERGVVIGAHAGYADRGGFGRRELNEAPATVARWVLSQVSDLAEIAAGDAVRVEYLKLHGAAYHRAGSDVELARAIVGALGRSDLAPLALLAQPGGAIGEVAGAAGWDVAVEGFCDRRYLASGELMDRTEPGSVLHDPQVVVRQAVSLAVEGGVRADDGSWVLVRPSSLCVHGDTAGAVLLATRIRQAITEAGIAPEPFAGPKRSLP